MTNSIIKGNVLKFEDNVNTDVIAPGRWMREGLEVLRLHTMEAIRPDFYKDVKPGDILVAGRNFGCGSHRGAATSIIKLLGISAIVADSLARIYFRNCIALGIPVFSASGVSGLVEEGDSLEITMGEDIVLIKNISKNKEMSAPPLPETMAKILEVGGMYELLRQRLAGADRNE